MRTRNSLEQSIFKSYRVENNSLVSLSGVRVTWYNKKDFHTKLKQDLVYFDHMIDDILPMS